MFQITATGITTDVQERTVKGKNGEDRTMAIVKFRTSVNRRQPDGSYANEGRFCEAIAYGKTAEIWLKRFQKDTPIEATGELEVETYTRQDGTVSLTYKVMGNDGLPPYINWAPTPRASEPPF